MTQSEIQTIKNRFNIIGNSEALNHAIDIAVQVASTDLSVLITGESGVGKEFFPQIIHSFSPRKHNAYIAVNCGAIPEGTIDSELFGHEKGAFTSASSDRKGYFEVANNGTIFLDEVGELPLQTQVRLLRVLEAGEFMRVGSSKVQKTNVRVVAATNLDLARAISQGKFREDLYYRLSAIPIKIPDLRERKEDINLLFRKFAADFAERYNMPPIRLTPNAQIFAKNYYWKGNVRQLKNIAEQISIIEQNRDIDELTLKKYLPNTDLLLPVITNSNSSFVEEKQFNSEREILYQVLFDMKKDIADLKHLVNSTMSKKVDNIHSVSKITPEIVDEPQYQIVQTSDNIKTQNIAEQHDFEDTEEYLDEPVSISDIEKEAIIKALDRYSGKRKYAANDLKISERTLYRKIKEYGLDK